MALSSQSSIPIPRITSARYNWSPHPSHSNIYRRCALGFETKWARQAPFTRQLFLTGRITLSTSESSESFHDAARKAWLRLRFLYPEVVMRASGDFAEDGGAIMQVEIPRNGVEAGEWAGRTLMFLEGGDAVDVVSRNGMDGAVEEVESALRSPDLPTDVDPVNVCWRPVFSPQRTTESKWVTDAAFCMRVDHGLADGMGADLAVGKYLALLAETLEVSKEGKGDEELDWEEATRRIPKAWVQMMDERQKTEGEVFEGNVRENTALILGSMKSRWGLSFHPDRTDYEPRSIHITFPPPKSRTVLQSVKRRLGNNYNITHLGHAAVIMTLLRAKPTHLRPLDEKPHLISPLFMNGRRYLDQGAYKAKEYVPMCRTISAIEFRDVERYICEEGDGVEMVWQKVRLAAEDARRGYERVRGLESLLSEGFGIIEVMATAGNDVKGKGMADAYFLSDGIIEQYTPASYSNSTNTQDILTLDDVRFTANPDGPSLIIRMSTFRDRIRFSAEWNGALYEESVIKGFLDGVVGIVESVVT